MRVRTTNSIFGFSIGGTFGDKYEEELTVSYRTDESSIKMNAEPA
jgi:hypothetical protein